MMRARCTRFEGGGGGGGELVVIVAGVACGENYNVCHLGVDCGFVWFGR